MVRIRLAGNAAGVTALGFGTVTTVEATLESGRWHCPDTRVTCLLNAMRAPWQTFAGARLEFDEAAVVSKILGAEILES